MKFYLKYAKAFIVCIFTTLVSWILFYFFDSANIIMLFLLTVMLLSISYGAKVGIFSSFISVLIFDFFFVEPLFSFTVNDLQYIFTFVLMLIVSLIISHLSAKIQQKARLAQYEKQKALSLVNLAKELSSCLRTEDAIEISSKYLLELFNINANFILPNLDNVLFIYARQNTAQEINLEKSQKVYAENIILSDKNYLYVPLKATMRTRGVLVCNKNITEKVFFNACINQISLTLERIHYVEISQKVLIDIEAEKLKNSMLSLISHDLQTPITSIIGLADILHNKIDASSKNMAYEIKQKCIQLSKLINNILYMAKTQQGIELNKEWNLIQEIVASACSHIDLANYDINIDINFTNLIKVDALVLERVIVNILDNAIKYAPSSIINISAKLKNTILVLSIKDNGNGFNNITKVFIPFSKQQEDNIQGMGLGLSICKRLIKAHGGDIEAYNDCGAVIKITIPVEVYSE